MRQISILHKIIIAMLIAVTVQSVSIYYYIYSYYDNLIELRKVELKRKVELAISIVEGHRETARKNKTSIEEAEKQAFTRIEKLRFGKEGYFYIFEGTVLRYHGVSPYLKNTSLMGYIDENGNDVFFEGVKKIQADGEAYIYWPWQRENSAESVGKLSYNRAIPGTDLWIGTGVYIDDLQNIYWGGSSRTVIITICLTVFLILFSVVVGRSITQPLMKVRHRMISLAEGDVSSPVPEIDSKDEVGEMARAVETFRENKKYARELEVINTEIEKQARHDPLTGLANRRKFELQFEELKETCTADGQDIFLFHVDLDRFKQINDTLGHAAGDHVLVVAARHLNELTGNNDVVARIGGDEFLIAGPCRDNGTLVTKVAKNIISALSEPILYEGTQCHIGASIGIVIDQAKNADLQELVNRADIALYRAKDKGRNRYEMFSASMEIEVLDKNRTIEEFLSGLDLGHLVPYYQPQFDLRTLDVTGVEVLARWSHPVKGILTPEAFLTIAQDQKVMARISQAVALRALSDCVLLKSEKISVPKLSLNVSLDSLADPGLIDWLKSLMPFPTQLSFELAEDVPRDEYGQIVVKNIRSLKELGVQFEVDDFGSSNASIVGLLDIGPDRIKIDGALVSPVTTSLFYEKLLGTIAGVADALNVELIAEGVETLEHLAHLRQFRIQSFQGYALAAPMPFQQLKTFLAEEPWRKQAGDVAYASRASIRA